MSLQDKIDEAHDILDEAAEHANDIGARVVFAMFSGGHDSLVATHVAMNHGFADCVCHINTGIGIKRTRRFARRASVRNTWPMVEYNARDYVRGDGEPDPQRYEEFVLKRGFPGPGKHWKMYQRLKERPMTHLCRDFRQERGDKFMFVSGRRRFESARRMPIDDAIDIDDNAPWDWVQPILHFRDEHVEQYIERHELTRNPVVETICSSGECMCGAFAHDGELAEVGVADPDLVEWIEQLEERAEEAGYPWGWEDEPPDWWNGYRKGQGFLPNAMPDEVDQPMCQGCIYEQGEEVDVEEQIKQINTEPVD